MPKTILVAGGCGFVGSNLCLLLKNKYPDYKILALDNLKRRGSEINVSRLLEKGVSFFHGDTRNKEDIQFAEQIDTIIDAAAEPSVLAGIGNSTDYLIQTNYNGTINLLNLAVQHKSDFLFLSTSRVYPIASLESLSYTENETRFILNDRQDITGCSSKGITETFPLNGSRSLYGATKLASELMINEYQAFFNLRTVINRCGVIAGPHQMGKVDQGVIVLWMARHFWKKEVTYFGYGGEGKQVRDVLHIDDLFRLVDFQIHNMDKLQGKLYNVGGGIEVSVSLKELTALCTEITGNKIMESSIPSNRAGDIPIFITDNKLVSSELNWKPEKSIKEILGDIFQWIKMNEQQLKPILN